MVYCKKCGQEMSSSSIKCPKCGKTNSSLLRIIIGIIIIFIGFGMIFNSNEYPNNKSENSEKNQEKITMEKFNQIETDMTYEEVVSVVGEEGTISTESAYGDASMQIYYW